MEKVPDYRLRPVANRLPDDCPGEEVHFSTSAELYERLPEIRHRPVSRITVVISQKDDPHAAIILLDSAREIAPVMAKVVGPWLTEHLQRWYVTDSEVEIIPL